MENTEKNYLSLKNIYRLLTVNDYPIYSNGVIGEKDKRGLTLIKFWKQQLLYDWRNTPHGKMVWRTEGSKNRYHSELCNRKEGFPFYKEYIEEILEQVNPEQIREQSRIFADFLSGKQYQAEIFWKKAAAFLKKAEEDDPCFSRSQGEYFERILRLEEKWQKKGEKRDLLSGYLLTFLTLHAMAGDEVNGRWIRGMRCRAELQPEMLFDKQDGKKTELKFLTRQNGELCRPGLLPEQFFGRELELFDLKERVRSGGKYLVCGIGGVGKTELVRQLLRWCIQEGQGEYIGLIQYEGSLKNSFVKSFRNLHGDDGENCYLECKNQLEKLKDRSVLLFIDNIDTSLEEQELADLRQLPCTVIATSRIPQMEGFESYPVELLSKEAALLVFRDNYSQRITGKEQKIAEHLLEEAAHFHTMTIRFLGKAARARGWSVKQLEEHLLDKGLEVKWREGEREVQLQNLYRSMYQLGGLSREQKKLLRIFSVLPYRSYDKAFWQEFLEGTVSQSADLEELLKSLAQLGWLDGGEQGFAMHPVVAESIQAKPVTERETAALLDRLENRLALNETDTDAADNREMELVYLYFHVTMRVKGKVSEKFICQMGKIVVGLFFNRNISPAFLKDALSTLEKRRSGKAEALSDETAMYLELLETEKEPSLYWDPKLRNQCQKRLEDQWKHQTVPDELLYAYCLMVGLRFVYNGNIKFGESAIQWVLEQKNASIYHRLQAIYSLGGVLQSQMRAEECIAAMDQGIALAQKAGCPNHSLLVRLVALKVDMHTTLNQLAEATEALERLKELCRLHKVEEAPTLIGRYQADIQIAKGELEEACRTLEETKAISAEYYGTKGRSYIIICEYLGIVYSRLGRMEEALENHLKVLEFFEEREKDNFSLLSVVNNNIGVAYLGCQKPELALEHLQRSYELAADMSEIARAEPAWNMSRAWRQKQEPERELACLTEAYPIFQSVYGAEHLKTKAAKERLEQYGYFQDKGEA